MRYISATILFTAFVLHIQALDAAPLLPQPSDVQTALTLPNPTTSTQKGILIATANNLYLLEKKERATALTDSSVAKIVPNPSQPSTFAVRNRDGNLLATLTPILDRINDGGRMLAYAKGQPAGTAPLTYITSTGVKIALSGPATAVENAAKKSTSIFFSSMYNGKPYALFQNGGTTIGTFAVTLAAQ